MDDAASLQAAIAEPVELVPYDPAWAAAFAHEQARLIALAGDALSVLEHVGSTAVPGMLAKPVVDLLGGVASMQVADALLPLLCAHGYTTSAAFNASLTDRRWLMRHRAGRRTHHLHLVVAGAATFADFLRFRDALRSEPALSARYVALKRTLAATHADDREAYTNAKRAFVESVLARR